MSAAISRPAGSRSGVLGSDRSRSIVYHGFVIAAGFIMLYPLTLFAKKLEARVDQ